MFPAEDLINVLVNPLSRMLLNKKQAPKHCKQYMSPLLNSRASVHSLKMSIHFVLVNRLWVVNYSLRTSRNFKKGKFYITFYVTPRKPFVIFKRKDLTHLHNKIEQLWNWLYLWFYWSVGFCKICSATCNWKYMAKTKLAFYFSI